MTPPLKPRMGRPRFYATEAERLAARKLQLAAARRRWLAKPGNRAKHNAHIRAERARFRAIRDSFSAQTLADQEIRLSAGQ